MSVVGFRRKKATIVVFIGDKWRTRTNPPRQIWWASRYVYYPSVLSFFIYIRVLLWGRSQSSGPHRSCCHHHWGDDGLYGGHNGSTAATGYWGML